MPVLSLVSPATVALHREPDGSWQLRREGRPFIVRGAGGGGRLAQLAAAGGTALRTWHTADAGDLDEAHRYGLAVMAGLTVGHERHGFDYTDRARVERQRETILETVRRVKHHPALLVWGLGNETEGFERPDGNPPRLARARRPRRAHPRRGPAPPGLRRHRRPRRGQARLLRALLPARRYPRHQRLRRRAPRPRGPGPRRHHAPLSLLTEFGPVGHWEVRLTPWGVPLEPAGHDKAHAYLATHREILERCAGRCLGTFAFLWGHKQEVTPTWYGMFLPLRRKTAAVDAMTLAWSGHAPARPCPRITRLHSALIEAVAPPDRDFPVHADIDAAPAGAEHRIEWRVLAESTDRKIGGDPEAVPPDHPDAVTPGLPGHATVRTPSAPGAYRLFLYVRDAHGGGATANFPFFVSAA